jgi:histo-blood group ABO system transferase
VNIGIVITAVGNYSKYIEGLTQSIKNNFLPKEKITIYVFGNEIPILPWPLITLLRYHFICQYEKRFLNEDIIYWIDADMIVVDVDKEVLPDNTGLVGVHNPNHYKSTGTFERNKISSACIDSKDINRPYVQGCFQGGETSKFISMCKTLKLNIEKDLSKNYIALWHDESHLNKYFLDHPYKLLHPGYAYQAYLKLPFKKCIIHNVLIKGVEKYKI